MRPMSTEYCIRFIKLSVFFLFPSHEYENNIDEIVKILDVNRSGTISLGHVPGFEKSVVHVLTRRMSGEGLLCMGFTKGSVFFFVSFSGV